MATVLGRMLAGRQRSNERHSRRTLSALPLCPTQAAEKAGVTPTFPLVHRFHVSVHIVCGSITAEFRGREKP